MSWDSLTTAPAPDEVFGVYSTLYLLICAVGLAAAFVLYLRPEILWSRHLMRVATSRRWGAIFLWIFSLGIFFFIVGWLQINPFSFGERIWFVVTLIAAAIALALMLIELRAESGILSRERRAYQHAVARGTHIRRPPKRSRTQKR